MLLAASSAAVSVVIVTAMMHSIPADQNTSKQRLISERISELEAAGGPTDYERSRPARAQRWRFVLAGIALVLSGLALLCFTSLGPVISFVPAIVLLIALRLRYPYSAQVVADVPNPRSHRQERDTHQENGPGGSTAL
jgi:hypothetical protein